jgi:hypothetical protein
MIRSSTSTAHPTELRRADLIPRSQSGVPPDQPTSRRGRYAQEMPIEWTTFSSAALLVIGAVLYVTGGLRFRRWAIDDRPGIPRYSASVETVVPWLLYSGLVAVVIIVVRQTLRQL